MKILVVGCGSIGERNLRAFLQTGEAECSLCEMNTEKREKLKQTYSIIHAFSDFKEIDLSEFEGIIICTPADQHIPQALKAVEAGCHVLIEKPLSVNLDGIDALLAALASKKRVGGVAYVMRYYPGLMRIKELLQQGAVGEPMMMMVNTGQYLPRFRPDYQRIYFSKKETGGGVLMDFSTHFINLLEWYAGSVKEVACMFDRMHLEGIETDDACTLTLRFQNRDLAVINQNIFQKPNRVDLTIDGNLGSLMYDHLQGRVGIFDVEKDQWNYEDYPSERDRAHQLQASNFIAASRGEETIRTSIEEARLSLQTVLAARRSFEERQIVSLQ